MFCFQNNLKNLSNRRKITKTPIRKNFTLLELCSMECKTFSKYYSNVLKINFVLALNDYIYYALNSE